MTTDRGQKAMTDANGQYRIQGLSGLVNVALGKAGYETYFGFSEVLDRDRIVNAVIQRTIRLAPGERTEITVFRDDPDYDLAYAACSAPCKMIRYGRCWRDRNLHSGPRPGREQERLPPC